MIPAGEIITHIVIEKDETPMTNCLLPNNCTDYIRDYRTTLFVNETSQVISITVTMYNVTRKRTYKNGINWFIVYNFNVSKFICKILIFARIKSISCNTQMLDDTLNIICIASNIYHETQCDISVKHTEKKKNMISIQSINNNREMSSSEKTVFKTVCSVFISREDLSPGQYEAVVTMYPNITGTNDDKQFSTVHSLSVNLEYPSITVKNCPEIIEENTEVTCTCERTDKSLINVSIVWFDSSGHIIASNGSPHLKFKATSNINRDQAYFYCKTQSWVRWEHSNITIVYKPIIIVTVKNHTCKHENLPHEVTVTCETDLIYPAAKCHYTIYYNHVSIFQS
ncbi:unnamed protein product [Lymnaea stagnalis]|uniref:Ig-like domain-containing protein n=1 Tax=Lymnaea stagnalis TaxID=6523 RepID=A0AAV2HLV6_LYMST